MVHIHGHHPPHQCPSVVMLLVGDDRVQEECVDGAKAGVPNRRRRIKVATFDDSVLDAKDVVRRV
jgi:hypothetical protein